MGLCSGDAKCMAIEVNGCLMSSDCDGLCYTFEGIDSYTSYSSGDCNPTAPNACFYSGNCVTNGDQKAYRHIHRTPARRRLPATEEGSRPSAFVPVPAVPASTQARQEQGQRRLGYNVPADGSQGPYWGMSEIEIYVKDYE